MAVIKQTKVPVIRNVVMPSRDITVGQTSAFCVIPDSGDAIYFCGEAFARNSLYPLEARVPSAISSTATPSEGDPIRVSKALENAMFLTSRAYAFAPRHADNDPSRNYFPWKIKAQYRYNLDLNTRVNASGKLLKFTDQTGVAHTIYSNVNLMNESHVTYTRFARSSIVLVQGEDLNNPVISRRTYPQGTVTVAPGTPTYQSQEFYPMYVDTVNHRVWGMLPCVLPTASTSNFYIEEHTTRPAYITYSTVGESGTLVLNENEMFIPAGLPAAEANSGCILGGENGSYFFMGATAGGDTYWLLTSEQDVAQGTTWATREGDWTAAPGPYWGKNTNGTRITIVKVGADLTNTILLGPLNKTTGWSAGTGTTTISDNFGHHMMPSPFAPSSKAGEANVFYSYMPVASLTDVVRYLVVRWDKNDDSFDVRETTLNGFDPHTYYRHPTGRNTRLLMAYPSLEIITAASGNQYLVQFTRHYLTSNFVALGSANEAEYNSILVMAIDNTDPTTLSYSQSVSNARLLDMIPMETHGRRMLAITEAQLVIYDFDEVNFLSAGVTSSGKYFAAGKDINGNIWGVSSDTDNFVTPTVGASPYNLGGTEFFVPTRLEFITDSLTARAEIAFEDASIEYSGVNLSKNIIVNAYDSTGTRISTSLILKLSSDVATFTSNSLKTITVSTSAAADTIVNITITGAGSINASASFTV